MLVGLSQKYTVKTGFGKVNLKVQSKAIEGSKMPELAQYLACGETCQEAKAWHPDLKV